MPSDRLGGALAAAAMLAFAAPPVAASGTVIWVPLCHGGFAPLSMPRDGGDPGKGAPAGCHAPCLCQRKSHRTCGN
jgi:hypothetical protein